MFILITYPFRVFAESLFLCNLEASFIFLCSSVGLVGLVDLLSVIVVMLQVFRVHFTYL